MHLWKRFPRSFSESVFLCNLLCSVPVRPLLHYTNCDTEQNPRTGKAFTFSLWKMQGERDRSSGCEYHLKEPLFKINILQWCFPWSDEIEVIVIVITVTVIIILFTIIFIAVHHGYYYWEKNLDLQGGDVLTFIAGASSSSKLSLQISSLIKFTTYWIRPSSCTKRFFSSFI